METAATSNGEPVKLRQIKITKRIADTIRNISTVGWIHINPSDKKWRVRKHGSFRASGIYDDKETAITAAKKFARSYPDPYIFVHDKNADVVQTIHK
jgi:hypothetical protein